MLGTVMGPQIEATDGETSHELSGDPRRRERPSDVTGPQYDVTGPLDGTIPAVPVFSGRQTGFKVVPRNRGFPENYLQPYGLQTVP